jgi:hypothetical protein
VLSAVIVKPNSGKASESAARVVHYASFRFVMLLAVAVHKRNHIDVLLNTIINSHASNKEKAAAELPDQDLELLSKKNNRYEMNFNHQAEHYQKQARLILKKLETLKLSGDATKTTKKFTQQKRQELYKRLGSVSSEDKLRAIFMSYTGGSKVMALDQFVRMCEACDLIQSDFHTRDARLVFKNAILLASSPTAGKALNDGIIDKKFIMYSIFRGFAIPHIAQKKKKNRADIIELFI